MSEAVSNVASALPTQPSTRTAPRSKEALFSAVTLVALALLPFGVEGFVRYALTLMLAQGICALSGTFLIRYSGEVSIGQNFFIAVGAYASAILTMRYGVPFLLSGAIAVALSVVAGLLFAFPSRGLSGVYLSVATLALGLAAPDLLLHFSEFTGGVEGLQLDTAILNAMPMDLQQYYFALAALMVTVFVIHRFRHSRIGLMILTARDHPHAAASFGMKASTARLGVVSLSAAIAGLGGMVFAFTTSLVSPNSFTFWSSVILLVGSVVSNYSVRIYGVVVAGAFVALMPQLLSSYGQITPMIYGALLLGITLIANLGLPALLRRWRHKHHA